jgi:hypothetical protein
MEEAGSRLSTRDAVRAPVNTVLVDTARRIDPVLKGAERGGDCWMASGDTGSTGPAEMASGLGGEAGA